MLYAKMEISKNVFNAREKSVPLMGIFGDIYAPKSKMKNIEEINVGAVEPHIRFLVPFWVFSKNGYNPCQFDAYIETVEIK